MQIRQQRLSLCLAQQGHDQAAEFAVNLQSLGSDVFRRNTHIKTTLKGLAIVQGNLRGAQGSRPAIAHNIDLAAQGNQIGRPGIGIGIAFDVGRILPGKGKGCRVAQAEFDLQARIWFLNIANRQRSGSNGQINVIDLVRVNLRLISQIPQDFDGRMGHITGSVKLEQIFPHMKAALRRLGGKISIEIIALGIGETLAGLKHIRARRKTTFRQTRRQQTVARRLARMQRLAHGAELGFQARGLGGRNAKGPGHGLAI